MQAPDPKPMTLTAFLDWEFAQEEKYEFVDGAPVLRRTRMMAGGTLNHGLICAKVIAALTPRLRGSSCAPLTSDVRVITGHGAVRYPDVTVDYGPRAANQLEAKGPKVIFEVLSPSNPMRQQLRLLDDYQSIETVEQVVFLAQNEVSALIWTREAGGWRRDEAVGEAAEIALTALGFSVPLSEVYEGAALEG